jgi:hypothetical protein
MGLDIIAEGVDRFTKFLGELTSVIGHADQAAPLRHYFLGLVAAFWGLWPRQAARA